MEEYTSFDLRTHASARAVLRNKTCAPQIQSNIKIKPPGRARPLRAWGHREGIGTHIYTHNSGKSHSRDLKITSAAVKIQFMFSNSVTTVPRYVCCSTLYNYPNAYGRTRTHGDGPQTLRVCVLSRKYTETNIIIAATDCTLCLIFAPLINISLSPRAHTTLFTRFPTPPQPPPSDPAPPAPARLPLNLALS